MISLSDEERQIAREFLIAMNVDASAVDDEVDRQTAFDIRTVLGAALEVPHPPVAYDEDRIEEFYERLNDELFGQEE